MIFVETTIFTKHFPDYLEDEEYRGLQNFLHTNPTAGDVIQGTGGLRKIRWASTKRGKGKRGGSRVIYYYRNAADQIYFLTIYDKGEITDLSSNQKKQLKQMLGGLFNE